VKNPYSASSKFWYAFRVTMVVLLWGVPWVAVGILLCASIIGIPLGVLCIGIGAAPYTRIEKKRIAQQVAWYNRDRSYAEEYEEEVPWEL
jgi:hypothetical protein